MADTVFSELPVAAALSGLERVPISVPTGLSQAPWTSETTTIANIWNQFNGGSSGCSMRQWLTALADSSPTGAVDLFNSIPADITNALYIQYNHGARVFESDLVWTETQLVLGYTNPQMLVLLALAQTLPI